MPQKLSPRIRISFPLLALTLQCIIIVLFVLFLDYHEYSPKKYIATYAAFQDVNTMVFLGFGFMVTFLKRYGRSGIAFNMLLAAFALQWATILEGLLFEFENSKIRINMTSVIHADLSAVSALVSIGAILGNTSPIQLLLMAILEVTCFTANKWLLKFLFQFMPVLTIYNLTNLCVICELLIIPSTMKSKALMCIKDSKDHQQALQNPT
ncbi:ammonium transporter Rh type B-like [Rhincodon typus]|uniref:ammonium transporter Rh type B-like n=1 Tax=Rhincodon typus TaxID=259920 RepID=UPI00202DD2F7|nr:ammonium transporter Rh type B-like [Rhincodon typus]